MPRTWLDKYTDVPPRHQTAQKRCKEVMDKRQFDFMPDVSYDLMDLCQFSRAQSVSSRKSSLRKARDSGRVLSKDEWRHQ